MQECWRDIWKHPESLLFHSPNPSFPSLLSCYTSNLKRHMKVHTWERSNKCNQCDYNETIMRHLKTHIANAIPAGPQKPAIPTLLLHFQIFKACIWKCTLEKSQTLMIHLLRKEFWWNIWKHSVALLCVYQLVPKNLLPSTVLLHIKRDAVDLPEYQIFCNKFERLDQRNQKNACFASVFFSQKPPNHHAIQSKYMFSHFLFLFLLFFTFFSNQRFCPHLIFVTTITATACVTVLSQV